MIASPVEIAVSFTIGVDAFGNAFTTANAGAGKVVVVVVEGAFVAVGVVAVGDAGCGAGVSGAGVTGADVGPNESAQFSPGAQDLKLKLKKTPIICPGSGSVSTTTATTRYLLANAFNSGWVIERDDCE